MKYGSHIYAQPALVSSHEQSWQGIQLEQHQLDAIELPSLYHERHLLVLHKAYKPVTMRQKYGSRQEKAVFIPNDLSFCSQGEYGGMSSDAPTHSIHLSIDSQFLTQLVNPVTNSTPLRLPFKFKFNDPLLVQLSEQLLLNVGNQHALGKLYIESLTNTLCYHLIANYTTHQLSSKEERRLSSPVLALIDAYVEANADQTVTLDALAGLANMSVFHFARLFKRTTGFSPYQYVIDWKIRQARQWLYAGDTPINRISDELGFASAAHFSAVFKRLVGQGPQEFRRNKLGRKAGI